MGNSFKKKKKEAPRKKPGHPAGEDSSHQGSSTVLPPDYVPYVPEEGARETLVASIDENAREGDLDNTSDGGYETLSHNGDIATTPPEAITKQGDTGPLCNAHDTNASQRTAAENKGVSVVSDEPPKFKSENITLFLAEYEATQPQHKDEHDRKGDEYNDTQPKRNTSERKTVPLPLGKTPQSQQTKDEHDRGGEYREIQHTSTAIKEENIETDCGSEKLSSQVKTGKVIEPKASDDTPENSSLIKSNISKHQRRENSHKELKGQLKELRDEINQLQLENQRLRDRLSSEIGQRVAVDPSLEDVSMANRPLALVDKFKSICDTESLDALESLQEADSVPEDKRELTEQYAGIMCSVIERSYKEAIILKNMRYDSFRRHNEERAINPFKEANHVNVQKSTLVEPKVNAKLEASLRDDLLTSAMNIPCEQYSKKLLNDLPNTSVSAKVLDTDAFKTYATSVCRLTWAMVLHEPPLVFTFPAEGDPYDPSTQQLFYSCTVNDPSKARVKYCVYPGIKQGDRLLIEARVFALMGGNVNDTGTRAEKNMENTDEKDSTKQEELIN